MTSKKGTGYFSAQRKVACPLFVALALAFSSRADAAARATVGGTLTIGTVATAPSGDPLLADTPEELSVLGLTASPLCRLEAAGPRPLLATLARRADAVVLSPLPWARAGGRVLTARELADALQRLVLPESPSPYRALLAPVRALPATLGAAVRGSSAELLLPLAFPWPDLEATLCHPALAPTVPSPAAARTPRSGAGPYVEAAGGRLTAVPSFPAGRPFFDALVLSPLPARVAERLFAGGRVQVVLGDGTEGSEEAPLLFATYLVFSARAGAGDARRAVLARVDVAELTEGFVPAPAVPMTGLLPPALMPQPAASHAPAVAGPGGSFVLGYDESQEVQRGVAERLQVVLHDAGWRVSLQPLPRAALHARTARGELDAALVSVLLPPAPAAALAVVLALAGAPELLATELPPLGALSDTAARAARARERALALAGTLRVFPLFARGIRARLGPVLVDARRDAFGLLVLDDAWRLRE